MKEWKGVKAQRVKCPTQTQEMDTLLGNKKQIKTEEEKERNRVRVPNPPTLDPSVSSYDT